MATTPRYPKISTQDLIRYRPQNPRFDIDVPSPLSQAVSRRLVEQEQADAKQADMKLSPLDKAVSALKATASMGTMLFQAIQQAPKALQGEDAYTEAIGNTAYIPEDPKALEYMGDFGNMLEKLETEYKIPPLMPEAIPFQPLANLAVSQAGRGVAQGATRAGMAAERALDQPVTDIMNRGGRGAGLLSSFATNPAQVIKPKGGNWLGGEMSGATVGNVDRSLRRLQTTTVAGDTPAQRIPKHEALLNDPTLNQDQLDRVRYQLEQTKGEAALDNWIERNVGNYIKKEMGTPEDPVRLMMDKRVQEIETQFQVDMNRAQRTRERAEAEPDPRRQANMMRQAQREEEQAKFDRDFANEYVTHLPKGELEELSQPSEELMQKRLQEGFQMLGEAKSDPAQRWENLTDDAIGINRAGDIQAQKDAMTKAQDAERAFLDKDDEINRSFRPLLIETLAQRGEKHSDKDIDALVQIMPTSQKAEFLGEGEAWNALRNESQQARINVNSGLWGAYNENKWVDKLDPEANVYSAYIGDLGIDHVIDVIGQDVAAGRIRPEQLNKLSMDQAIKRTAEFNMEQAKKMQETAIKNMEGFPTYKEYGDEGYKWVELKKPEDLTELPSTHQLEPYESIVHGGTAYRVVNKETGMKGEGFKTPERATSEFLKEHSEERLADALRYEGDTMGHCVGGYCPDVVAGKSRIYSLRDKRGEPHVTVEVKPARSPGWAEVKEAGGDPLAVTEEAKRRMGITPENEKQVLGQFDPEKRHQLTEELNKHFADIYREKFGEPPSRIVQIKGKQNAAPKEDYLPYVQDFVRSGQWSDVGDFKNTGLMRAEDVKKAGWDMGDIDQKYLTKQEYDDLLLKQLGNPPPEGMKAGGRVGFTDNPDSMMMELEDRKFAGGGIAKKVISKLARAPAKSAEEIRAVAQRMAPQIIGEEFVRGSKGTKSIAEKTQKQFAREKEIKHDIRPTVGEERPAPKAVDLESLKGNVMIGIPGDPTITGQTVHSVAGRELATPAPQHGGPLYGLGREDDAFWASSLGAANRVQNLAREVGEQYDAPVLGNYVMMGPDSYSFAQHFADTNLQNIRPEEMTKAQIRGFNEKIKKGYPYKDSQGVMRQRVFPSFPGIENPEEMYLHMSIDPDLRKHFGNLMQMPSVTEKFNLPSGQDVAHAVTEPSLRNLEIGVTGKSIGRMRPEVEELKLSSHPTYTHDIPGEYLGGLDQPVPYELSFPDTVKSVRENPRQAGQEFGSFKMVGPRQIIDPQLIDELSQYREFIKQYTGKKTGGLIKVKRKAGGGIISKAAKEALERMKPAKAEMAARGALWDKKMAEDSSKYLRDVEPFNPSSQEIQDKIKSMQDVKKAIGGAINADDLILTERPL
jgi:hypothetical protein